MPRNVRFNNEKTNKMKQIIESNYESILSRGLIEDSTTLNDFMAKIHEETTELQYEIDNLNNKQIGEELADVVLTCLNMAKHYNIDIEKEMRGKIAVNFERAKHGK